MRNILIAGLLALGMVPAHAGDADNGKKLAKKWECVDCHGLSGNSRSDDSQPIPMLAGQPATYLVKAMKEYKSGARNDFDTWSRMSNLMQGLSDQDMADMAAHYAKQKRF